jgi:uncharacterized protein (DUF2147 family)
MIAVARVTCAVTFFLAASDAAIAPAAELSPVGRWKTIDDNTGKPKSIVRIWEEGGKLFGKVESLILQPGEDPAPKCTKCEGERKDKPVIGMVILWDLTKDGSEWSGGKILDPDNGKTYRCYVEPVEGGAKLKVRGYIGFALLGRTQYWLRAE